MGSIHQSEPPTAASERSERVASDSQYLLRDSVEAVVHAFLQWQKDRNAPQFPPDDLLVALSKLKEVWKGPVEPYVKRKRRAPVERVPKELKLYRDLFGRDPPKHERRRTGSP